MAVQGEDTLMNAACLQKGTGFLHQPLKKRHHAVVSAQDKTFGVPLHAQKALVLSAFHRFNHTVGRTGTYLKQTTRLAYSLVMERIDGNWSRLNEYQKESVRQLVCKYEDVITSMGWYIPEIQNDIR